MTEDQYWKLCGACDALLLKPGVSKARIATGWLHILREHPLLLRKYEMLFASTFGAALTWRCALLLTSARYLLGYIRSLYRALQANGEPYWFSAAIEGQPDILFISHLLNSRQAGMPDDFYFGGLPESLAADGFKVAVLLINHTSEDGAKLAGSWSSKRVPRIVLANILNCSGEIEIQKQVWGESRCLAAVKDPDGEVATAKFDIRVRQQASVEVLSGMTRKILRQSAQFELLMNKLRPRILLTTHEGHAWERMAFAAARSISGIHCIGYIQGTLSRLQHAVQRNLGDAFNPDLVLTAGAAAKAQLTRRKAARRIPVEELGSNRWIQPAGSPRAVERICEKPACLVVPEGIISECRVLFLFSLECAMAMPSVNFIWRLHPLITFEMLRKEESEFNSLPDNITLSSSTIEADLSLSQWALYRGSTAIVQCGAAGLRPIYLSLPGELPFDALHELQEWRHQVSTVEDFRVIVSRDMDSERADEMAMQRESANATDYIASIYTPLNADALKRVVAFRRYSAVDGCTLPPK